jgi:hypothetical protein
MLMGEVAWGGAKKTQLKLWGDKWISHIQLGKWKVE